jgi:hypothetical protein
MIPSCLQLFDFQDQIIWMNHLPELRIIVDQKYQDNARTEIIVVNTLAIEINKFIDSRMDRETMWI